MNVRNNSVVFNDNFIIKNMSGRIYECGGYKTETLTCTYANLYKVIQQRHGNEHLHINILCDVSRMRNHVCVRVSLCVCLF